MYQPKFPPFASDAKEWQDHVYSELQAIAQSQYDARDFMQLTTLNVAPKKPRDGMIVKADGVNWNPGSGAGVYVYSSGAYTKLGSSSSGTVTSVSVATANGFSGSVATPSTTPAITLSTSVSGMLKGNVGALAAALSGTDYSAGTSSLATGILKSTTATGALSIAVAADFPTLNQSTTGNAATATKLATARTIDGQSFDGSANITVIAPGTNAAASKATPVDADQLPLVDSAATNTLKQLTWANLKATLKTYLDTLYQPLASALTSWASVVRASGFDTFVATPSSANLRALLTDESGSGALLFAGGNIGAATGTSLAVTGALTSSGGGVGYATGAGGTVTQATSKATAVTLNTFCGTITMNAASLAAATTVSFTLTNSQIAAGDFVAVQHSSVGTLGAYNFAVTPAAGSCSIAVRNVHTAALAEAIVLRFFVNKAVTA